MGETVEGLSRGEPEEIFLATLRGYSSERGADAEPPLFAKRPVNQFKLWQAVMEQGGYNEVTAKKGWARIGRLFDPPKTMTDLSFRIKKIYEVSMLPFEKAVRDGHIQDVPIPNRVEFPKADKVGTKESSPRPKKQARSAKAAKQGGQSKRMRAEMSGDEEYGDADMLNKRIRVLWPAEGQFFSGTVSGPGDLSGTWQIIYDDGDVDVVDLNEETWHIENSPSPTHADIPNKLDGLAMAAAGSGERVASERESPQEPSETVGPASLNAPLAGEASALPPASLPTTTQEKREEAAAGQDHERKEPDSQAGTPGPDNPAVPAQVDGDSGLKGDSGMADRTLRRGSAGEQEACLLEGDGYRVYEASDSPSYEIFCLVPGLSLDEIRVQCWDSGKLLVTGAPKDPGESKHWGVQQIKRKLRLPSPVHAASARALVTMHGQLYIKVNRQQAS